MDMNEREWLPLNSNGCRQHPETVLQLRWQILARGKDGNNQKMN